MCILDPNYQKPKAKKNVMLNKLLKKKIKIYTQSKCLLYMFKKQEFFLLSFESFLLSFTNVIIVVSIPFRGVFLHISHCRMILNKLKEISAYKLSHCQNNEVTIEFKNLNVRFVWTF